MSGTTTEPLRERLREIEDAIEQAREAIGMAQGSATDPIVSDDIEALQNERDRLLAEAASSQEL